MENKEFIITADSSPEIKEEAIKSILTNNIGGLQFNAMQTMALVEDEPSQTLRVFSANGTTVTVTEDAYVEFIDEYFRIKSESEQEELQTILDDAKHAQMETKEMWENAGYEYPFEIK